MKRKTISLPLDVHDLVSMIKSEYEGETSKSHSYPSIIFMLCQSYLKQQEEKLLGSEEITIKGEDSDLRKQLDETNDFIKDAFMRLIDNTKNTVVVTGGGGTVGSPIIEVEQLEEGKRVLSEEEIKKIKAEMKLLGEDFVAEMDLLYDSGAISPATIAQINGVESPLETPEEHRERRKKEIQDKIKRRKNKSKGAVEVKMDKAMKGVFPPNLNPPPTPTTGEIMDAMLKAPLSDESECLSLSEV